MEHSAGPDVQHRAQSLLQGAQSKMRLVIMMTKGKSKRSKEQEGQEERAHTVKGGKHKKATINITTTN